MDCLKSRGLIEVNQNGYITLTEKGMEAARKIMERHEVLTDILIRLGIDEVTAAEDACRIEHVISDKTFSGIKKYYAKNK